MLFTINILNLFMFVFPAFYKLILNQYSKFSGINLSALFSARGVLLFRHVIGYIERLVLAVHCSRMLLRPLFSLLFGFLSEGG